MRFHIFTQSQSDGSFRRVEVEGERIDFPQYKTELFAIHANPLAPSRGEPAYMVTHIGTGMRVAGGKTPSTAISAARRLIDEKPEKEFWRAIAAARQFIKATQVLA